MRFLLSFATALAATATAVPSTRAPHEKRETLSAPWKLVRRARAEQVVPVRIGMKQRNLEEGARILEEISDQNSPNYGQWWSVEEVHDFFAPAIAHVESVKEWLNTSRIHYNRTSISANKQWVQFDATIEQLENLLDTQYHVYEHEAGHAMPSCEEYYVPAHLRHVVDYVTPGVNLGPSVRLPITMKRPPPLPSDLSDNLDICWKAVTPACIKAMYNITDGTRATPGNELGVIEGLGDHYSQKDLDTFFKELYPEIPRGTHPIFEGIDGANGPVSVDQAGGESDLDFQVSYPIIWPQNSILFQVPDVHTNILDPFVNAIDGSYCTHSAHGGSLPSPLGQQSANSVPGGSKGQLQCGVYRPTNVISISYSSDERGNSLSHNTRQCNEYMKLGLQGVSVVVSSGDDGVSCDLRQPQTFSPRFPASCPYVTAVGATALALDSAVTDPQISSTDIASGGGFSTVFARPDYQKQAVDSHLSNYPPSFVAYQGNQTKNKNSTAANQGVYSSAGRAYPDLSAIGQDIMTYVQGDEMLLDGTSAAAPVVASILTRINEERLAQGKPTVGFINPTIYAHPEAFRDVVKGSNPGLGAQSHFDCYTPGFNATPG